MKKNLILISILACLVSCGGNPGNGGAPIDDSDKQGFYNSEITNFATDGLSEFYVSDGYGNGTPFGNTWSNTCVEIENDVLKMSIKEAGFITQE